MKSISNILVTLVLMLSFTACSAQIKNAKTETVKIYGNCGMCKEAIQKAGNIKKTATVDWNKDTQLATITYDTKKTNQDEIIKRIALAGYDSDKFLAPAKAYNDLPGCCQYDRVAKVPMASEMTGENLKTATQLQNDSEQAEQTNPLQSVFDYYFEVKEALVKTDGLMASTKSAALLSAINAVKMDQLETSVHLVWMKVLADVKEDANHIADTKDISHQRDHFMTLSSNIYALIQVSKTETTTYYQFCPMANDGKGAHWLSKDSTIKNPYYGAQMLSCGKTVETIK